MNYYKYLIDTIKTVIDDHFEHSLTIFFAFITWLGKKSIGTIILKLYRFIKNNKKSKKKILSNLLILLGRMDADRVHLFKFKNGEVDINNENLEAFCELEIALETEGIKGYAIEDPPIKVFKYYPFLELLLKEEFVFYIDVENIDITTLKNTLQTKNIISFITYLVKDKNDKPYGYLSVEYIRLTAKEDHNKSITDLKKTANIISKLL